MVYIQKSTHHGMSDCTTWIMDVYEWIWEYDRMYEWMSEHT